MSDIMSFFLDGGQPIKDVDSKLSGRLLPSASESLLALTPGHTVIGQILDCDNGRVTIRLEDSSLLHAGLQQAMNLKTGSLALFEIKSNTAHNLVLTPLFENLTHESVAVKALQHAGVDVGKETLGLVSGMMKEGMSIDKNTVLEVLQTKTLLPEADIKETVLLAKLKLDATPENLNQLRAYNSFQYKLGDAISSLPEAVTETCNILAKTEGHGAAAEFIVKTCDILSSYDMPGEPCEPLSGISDGEVSEFTTVSHNMSEPEDTAASESENGILKEYDERSAISEADSEPFQILREKAASVDKFSSESLDLYETGETYSETYTPEKALQKLLSFIKASGADIQNTDNVLTTLKAFVSSFSDITGHAGVNLPEDTVSAGYKEKAQTPAGSAAVLMDDVVNSREFLAALKGVVSKKFRIAPEDAGNEKNISDLYSRAVRQSLRLSETLGSVSRQELPLGRVLNSLNANLDFISQLNNTMHFLQLPLRNMSGESHGELYVYTNRKKKLSDDGSVSAFLHLEMEHLGTVDVKIHLKAENLNTNFMLRDSEALELVMAHIDELTERLNSKGYSAAITVEKLSGEDVSPVERILNAEGRNAVISEFAFDVRA